MIIAIATHTTGKTWTKVVILFSSALMPLFVELRMNNSIVHESCWSGSALKAKPSHVQEPNVVAKCSILCADMFQCAYCAALGSRMHMHKTWRLDFPCYLLLLEGYVKGYFDALPSGFCTRPRLGRSRRWLLSYSMKIILRNSICAAYW